MTQRRVAVFVAVAGEDRIQGYLWDDERARLERMAQASAVSRPGPLAWCGDRNMLYAGLRGTNQISAFRVSFSRPQPGMSLEQRGTFPLPSDPCYLSLDATGQWLMAAYYGAGRITLHRLQEDGTLSPQASMQRRTGPKAHCIHPDQRNSLLLVPHVGDENAVHQFQFDAASGGLTSLATFPWHQDEWVGPAGPRHYAFHRSAPSVYFSNEHQSSVTHCRYGPQGIERVIETLSTLPEPMGFANTCAQIHLDPQSRFLYVSNRGHNSLAIFLVDPESGRLTLSGFQETERTPRVFAILPDGSHLLCGGLDSGCITVYGIDPDRGHLYFRSRIRAGASPMWILPVTMDPG